MNAKKEETEDDMEGADRDHAHPIGDMVADLDLRADQDQEAEIEGR